MIPVSKKTLTTVERDKYLLSAILWAITVCILSQRCYAQQFHINAYKCTLSEDDRLMLDRLGKFEAKFYDTIFDTQSNDSLPVNINLYGNHKEYEVVEKQVTDHTFSNGFYSPIENRVFIYKDDRYLKVLLHETSHDLLANNLKYTPAWLTEGIAQLFENLVIKDGDVFYSPQYLRLKYVKELMDKRMLKLSDYFITQDCNWSASSVQKADYLYNVSYSIVYFFVKFDIDYLERIMLLQKKGETTRQAIIKVFGGFDIFEKRYNDFYKTINP